MKTWWIMSGMINEDLVDCIRDDPRRLGGLCQGWSMKTWWIVSGMIHEDLVDYVRDDPWRLRGLWGMIHEDLVDCVKDDPWRLDGLCRENIKGFGVIQQDDQVRNKRTKQINSQPANSDSTGKWLLKQCGYVSVSVCACCHKGMFNW